MQSREDVHAVWSGLLSEQNKSGQSAAAFCRDRNLSIKSFAYYRKRLSDKSPAPQQWAALMPEKHSTVPLEAHRSLTVQIGIARVEITAGFDQDLLRAIVAALEPPC
jgi:hypothetical protein